MFVPPELTASRDPSGGAAVHIPVGRKLPPPPRANIALAAVLVSAVVGGIALPAALVLGYGLFGSLKIMVIAQLLAFCMVVLFGLFAPHRPASFGPPDTPDGDGAPLTADIWTVYPSRLKTDGTIRTALIAENILHSRSIASDLADLGHEVHHSTDCAGVLESVQARPQDWDLVMYDLDLPGNDRTGMQEIETFRAEFPEIPVLLVSGSRYVVERTGSDIPSCGAILRKPVFRNRLVERLGATDPKFVVLT